LHRAEIADRLGPKALSRLLYFDQVGHLDHAGHGERGREHPIAFGCGQVAAQRHHAVGGAHVDSAGRDRVLAAALTVPGVVQVTNLIETDDPVGDLGPMQSGIATGR